MQTSDRDWGGGAGVRAARVGAGSVVQLGAILMPHFMEEDTGPRLMPHSIRSQGAHHPAPHTGGLNNRNGFSLTLETRCPRWRCGWVGSL